MEVVLAIPLCRPATQAAYFVTSSSRKPVTHTLEPGTTVNLSRTYDDVCSIVYRQKSGSFWLATGIPHKYLKPVGNKS